MKSHALFRLRLRFAPFSNRVGELWDTTGEMNDFFKGSHLYMVAQRPEIFFSNFKSTEDGISFDLTCGNTCIPDVVLPLGQFSHDSCDIWVKADDRLTKIGLWGLLPYGEKLLQWFTPDRLLFFYSRGVIDLSISSDFYKLSVFHVHYVGISKQADSFHRLFIRAHKKRAKILGVENATQANSEITDELSMLIFDLEDLRISNFNAADDTNQEDLDAALGRSPLLPPDISAEAERAFVKLLDSKYNEIKFVTYPRLRTDTFMNARLDSYLFRVSEYITLRSGEVTLQGRNDEINILSLFQSDGIRIKDGTVHLLTSVQPQSGSRSR